MGQESPLSHGLVRRANASPLAEGGAPDAGFKDRGGKILTRVQITVLFWGKEWGATPAPNPSIEAFSNAIRATILGPYMRGLYEYRGITKGKLVTIDTDTSSSPAATKFVESEIIQHVKDRIAAPGSGVPKPSSNADNFYAVILPQGYGSSEHSDDAGRHFFFDTDSGRGYIAWVTNDGTMTSGNSVPKVFFHELVEACTDPDLQNGILDGSGNEIGDACNNDVHVIGGIALQSYWSIARNQCILTSGSGSVKQTLSSFSLRSGIGVSTEVERPASIRDLMEIQHEK
jgi:hypothetical protein